MSLKGLAQDTLRIIDAGRYEPAAGVVISFDAVTCRAGTRLFTPEMARALALVAGRPAHVEVTRESTTVAGRRLLANGEVAILNFASARNPGGGFITGARAQEEDLARCSALYPCLLTQPRYYEANRAMTSLEYSDHLIWSPQVPFFRDDRLELIERPFALSVITSPAPNAGGRPPLDEATRRAAFLRRGCQVLSVARHFGQKQLVLGAWGCGAFHNDAAMVAEVFDEILSSNGHGFECVTFAILERGEVGPKYEAFRSVLSSRSTKAATSRSTLEPAVHGLRNRDDPR